MIDLKRTHSFEPRKDVCQKQVACRRRGSPLCWISAYINSLRERVL
jgi:hypothetical protein